ncbi:MAG TPA: SigE family RNA polymerase sigma factor [Acidimicrobiales bacterium]|jgi:RNA polymerase sigma-70 factor (sigma-E family)
MTVVPIEDGREVAAWPPELVRLYEDRYDELVRLAYLLTGSAAVAEELVQDAFVATHAGWSRVREPLAYVRGAVVNRSRSWGRRVELERRRPPTPPEDARLEADELWDALAVLNDRQRAAIVLRYYDGLPDREIAAVLGCRVPTVRTAVHRGLAALRREIER